MTSPAQARALAARRAEQEQLALERSVPRVLVLALPPGSGA